MVKSDDQHEHIDRHTVRFRFWSDYDSEYISTMKGHFEPRLDHLTTRLNLMTNINTSIDIPFDSVLYAEYEFYHILTSKGHF